MQRTEEDATLDERSDPTGSRDVAFETSLRLIARFAAEAAGAPWGMVRPRGGLPILYGAPPAALAAAAAGMTPREGRVATAAFPGGFAAAAARRGGLVAALAPTALDTPPAAAGDLVSLAWLAASALGVDERAARERDLMRMALDHMDQGLLVIEPDMSVPVLTRRTAELLCLPDELLDRRPTFPELVGWQLDSGTISAETAGAWFNAYIFNLQHLPEVDVYERETFDGKLLEVRTTRLPGGGFARTFTDQTVRKRREAAIAAADAENRRLFDNMTVGLYRADPQGRLLRANLALARLHGFADVEAFLAAAARPCQLHASAGWLDEFLRRLRRDDRVDDFVSEMVRLGTGERVWVSESAWAIRDETGAMIAFEGTVIDTSARRRSEEETARLAWRDALTGLNSRSGFMRQLAAALAAGEPVAVALLDLDRFKAVNDALGHMAGDELLREIGARIAALLGPEDVAARFGGDEFALILRGLDKADVAALAERVLAAVRAPATVAGREVALGASLGVAMAPDAGADPTELIRAADLALYRAKSEGRYAWRVFVPEMAAAAAARERLEIDLRAGLDRGEFDLAYQPVVEAATGRVIGYEALLRWTHPDRGPVPPEAFIAIAEETRLIGPIGAWALARACADAALWPVGRELWVNVSAVQLAHGRFEAELDAALAATGFPPQRLVVEITETSLMEGLAELAPLLSRLRKRGVRVALDDFGTGYSSLAYLRELPFDVIKIDRSFVRSLDEPGAAAIVASVLDLAVRLGMAAVAEGVETETQLAVLRAARCGFVQGHLYGPPLDAATIRAGG